jgi:hypothetical protein
MTRRTSSRVEKLEAVWRPQLQEYKTWELFLWDGTAPPEPFMTISWAPGRPTRTLYHKPVQQPAQALR